MALRPTRILVWLVVVAGVVAGGVALRPRPVQVDMETVARGSLRVTLDEEGETRVRDRFLVSAPVAGRVLRIEHEPGDEVVANRSALATFLPSAPTFLDARSRAEAEARVKAAEAALERTRVEQARAAAEQEFAQSELERYVELDEADLIAKDQLESAELRAETSIEARRSSVFAVRTSEFELEVARASLLQATGNPGGRDTGDAAITLRSPIDGVVLQRLRESEAIVPAGEPLLEVADPTRLEIVSDMLSTDAVRITPDDAVLIEQWGGGYALAGRVRRVEPYGFTKVSALGVEEQRVNVIIDFEDVREAWEALGDGYRVEVRVVIWESDDVLKVPTSSLFRTGDAWAVFAVDQGLASLRAVTVGQRNSLEAEILDGLQAEDRVIAYPSDQIVDGVAVAERETL